MKRVLRPEFFQVTWYRAADPRLFRLAPNVYYDTQVIGWSLQVGRRVVGIHWAQPKALTPVQNADAELVEASARVVGPPRPCWRAWTYVAAVLFDIAAGAFVVSLDWLRGDAGFGLVRALLAIAAVAVLPKLYNRHLRACPHCPDDNRYRVELPW